MGNKRCLKCDGKYRVSQKNRHKKYSQEKRDPKHVKFYNSKDWKMCRISVIMRDKGYCMTCGDIGANEVDHIIPLKVNWSLRYDMDNLQLLCHRCHTRKTHDDQRKYSKGEKNDKNKMRREKWVREGHGEE